MVIRFVQRDRDVKPMPHIYIYTHTYIDVYTYIYLHIYGIIKTGYRNACSILFNISSDN